MKRWILRSALCCLAAFLVLLAAPGYASLTSSKHNLSVSGTGTIKASAETGLCVFCHTPHNASPAAPLWNRAATGKTYTPYSSSTARGSAGQPTRGSLVCLSCHDGTIALGSVLSRATPIAMSGGVTTIPATAAGYLGTDLSDDHPVSINYANTYNARLSSGQGELVAPSSLTGQVRLDSTGQLQCTTCHDPHSDANPKMLVMANTASALCITCHVKNNWGQADHAISAKTWNGTAPNPWTHTSGTTVAANACESCHRPHSASFKQWLQNAPTEEANCYPCHNGNVAAKNIQAEFAKTDIHPIATSTGVHDAAEAALPSTARHVECQDCHNPHTSNATAGSTPGGSAPPTLAGSLAGVLGVDINGAAVKPATAEYQICFRCHADSTNRPAPFVARQIAQGNTRLEFAPGNPSFHPIAAPGKSTKVPSLIAPWTTASMVKCSDCHNNNAGPGAGGTGPRGPHGSTNRPLLERPYTLTGAPPATDICYKCHSQSTVTGASPHNRSAHLRYGCKACHDPHGINSAQGTAARNSRLINLSTTDNTPVGTGTSAKLYIDTTLRQCYMNCHGESHNGRSY